MFQMRKAHMQAFAETSRKSFEDRMVAHLQKHFPEHCEQLGEPAVRETIQYGIDRAATYGIKAERDVCKYIDLMCAFGPDFDENDRYHWAHGILTASKPVEPHARMECLFEQGQRELQQLEENRGG